MFKYRGGGDDDDDGKMIMEDPSYCTPCISSVLLGTLCVVPLILLSFVVHD